MNAFCFLFLMAVSKLISLGQLETTWRSRIHFRPLLVRVLHKSRLRYYGKPEKKMDMPYQVKRAQVKLTLLNKLYKIFVNYYSHTVKAWS